MVKLYGYEWKKLLKSRSFLLFTVMLLAASLVTLFQYEKHGEPYGYFRGHQWEAYRNGNGNEADRVYFESVRQKAEQYVQSYGGFLEQIPSQAEEKKKTADYARQDTFLYRDLEKTVSDYAKLSPDGLVADPGIALVELAQYDYGIVFHLLFVLVMSYAVVSMERKKGLFLLTKGTRKGHLPLAAAKLLVMTSASMVYSILQETGTVLLLGKLYGYGRLDEKIQSVSMFRDCSAALTVFEAIVVLVAARILIGVFCAVLMLCLSFVFRREGSAWLAFGSILGMEYILYRTVEISSPVNAFKCVNPFFVWSLRNLFGIYKNLNLFGFPVGKTAAALAAGIIFGMLLILAGMFRFVAACQISAGSLWETVRNRLSGIFSFQWHFSSVFLFELRKVFWKQKRGYALAVLLLLCLFRVEDIRKPVQYDDPADAEYHRILSEIGGPVTQESLWYVSEQRYELDQMNRQLERLEGSTDQAALFQAEGLSHDILMRETGTERVEEQLDELYLKPGNITDKFWVDEKSYIDLFTDYRYDLLCFLTGVIFVIIWICETEAYDSSRGLFPLLYSTKMGKASIQGRKRLVCLAGAFLGMCSMLIPQILRYEKIDHFQTAGQSLSDLTSIKLESTFSLGMLIAVLLLIKVLLFTAVSISLVMLVRRVESPVIVAGTGLCAAGMAVFLLWYFQMDAAVLLLRIL